MKIRGICFLDWFGINNQKEEWREDGRLQEFNVSWVFKVLQVRNPPKKLGLTTSRAFLEFFHRIQKWDRRLEDLLVSWRSFRGYFLSADPADHRLLGRRCGRDFYFFSVFPHMESSEERAGPNSSLQKPHGAGNTTPGVFSHSCRDSDVCNRVI